jgi:hypothetical protein
MHIQQTTVTERGRLFMTLKYGLLQPEHTKILQPGNHENTPGGSPQNARSQKAGLFGTLIWCSQS